MDFKEIRPKIGGMAPEDLELSGDSKEGHPGSCKSEESDDTVEIKDNKFSRTTVDIAYRVRSFLAQCIVYVLVVCMILRNVSVAGEPGRGRRRRGWPHQHPIRHSEAFCPRQHYGSSAPTSVFLDRHPAGEEDANSGVRETAKDQGAAPGGLRDRRAQLWRGVADCR